MKSTAVIAILLAVALVAGWLFFTSGADNPPRTEEQQAILETQDERLSKGEASAPVKIVEYADILCPYCAQAHQDTIPRIEEEYVDTGKVHYEMRLVGMIAPDSTRAAEGAYCAAEQDKFWQYIDRIYDYTWDNYYSQDRSPEDISMFNHASMPSLTKKLDILDTKQSLEWQRCLDNGRYHTTVTDNRTDMRKLRAYGTPHFEIAGQSYNGNPPYAAFKTVIDAALNKQQTEQ